MNKIQLYLLDNKNVVAKWNGRDIAYEGGYKIVADENNATGFELTSVPEQYEDAIFTVKGYNAAKEVAQDDINITKGQTFNLPVGMAVAGYAQYNITCIYQGETVKWLPIRFRVTETNPNWYTQSISPSKDVLTRLDNIETEVAELQQREVEITVDDTLSTDSENPVQNKVITEAINDLQNAISDINYKKPTTTLQLGTINTSVDMTSENLTRNVTNYIHQETNTANIDDNMKFTNTVTNTVTYSTPSATLKNENLPVYINVIFSSSLRTASFTLSGKDKKGQTFSATASITSYYPAFYGASYDSPTDLSTFTKTASASISGERTVTISGTPKYVWFCTTGTIYKITSGGFEVPFEQDGTLNYKDGNYRLYRTSNLVVAGTHTFTVN